MSVSINGSFRFTGEHIDTFVGNYEKGKIVRHEINQSGLPEYLRLEGIPSWTECDGVFRLSVKDGVYCKTKNADVRKNIGEELDKHILEQANRLFRERYEDRLLSKGYFEREDDVTERSFRVIKEELSKLKKFIVSGDDVTDVVKSLSDKGVDVIENISLSSTSELPDDIEFLTQGEMGFCVDTDDPNEIGGIGLNYHKDKDSIVRIAMFLVTGIQGDYKNYFKDNFKLADVESLILQYLETPENLSEIGELKDKVVSDNMAYVKVDSDKLLEKIVTYLHEIRKMSRGEEIVQEKAKTSDYNIGMDMNDFGINALRPGT